MNEKSQFYGTKSQPGNIIPQIDLKLPIPAGDKPVYNIAVAMARGKQSRQFKERIGSNRSAYLIT